ncbi:MAG: hypothetical protein ACFCU1_12390 [Sumerlaeia bacterium]
MNQGPYFSEEERKSNPLLEAEDHNGYFDALNRRRTLYGDRWFKVTGNTPEGIPVEDRVPTYRMLMPKISTRNNYTIDSQELYLAGISGRDLLEGLYILEQVTNKQMMNVVVLILFLPLLIFFYFVDASNPSAWLFWFSYLVLFVELHNDFKVRLNINGVSSRNELMRWRSISNKRIPLIKLFLDFVAILIGIVLVIILLVLGIFLISAIVVFIIQFSGLIKQYLEFISSPLWNSFILDQVGFHVGSAFFFWVALLLSITRESRRRKRIHQLIKTFENGRRDYDAYFLCDVVKDQFDGLGWVTYFYDFGMPKEDETLFEKFAKKYTMK